MDDELRTQIGIMADSLMSISRKLETWQLPIIAPIFFALVSLLTLAYVIEWWERTKENVQRIRTQWQTTYLNLAKNLRK